MQRQDPLVASPSCSTSRRSCRAIDDFTVSSTCLKERALPGVLPGLFMRRRRRGSFGLGIRRSTRSSRHRTVQPDSRASTRSPGSSATTAGGTASSSRRRRVRAGARRRHLPAAAPSDINALQTSDPSAIRSSTRPQHPAGQGRDVRKRAAMIRWCSAVRRHPSPRGAHARHPGGEIPTHHLACWVRSQRCTWRAAPCPGRP